MPPKVGWVGDIKSGHLNFSSEKVQNLQAVFSMSQYKHLQSESQNTDTGKTHRWYPVPTLMSKEIWYERILDYTHFISLFKKSGNYSTILSLTKTGSYMELS